MLFLPKKKKKDYKLTPTTKKTLVWNRVSDIFQININYGRKMLKKAYKNMEKTEKKP